MFPRRDGIDAHFYSDNYLIDVFHSVVKSYFLFRGGRLLHRARDTRVSQLCPCRERIAVAPRHLACRIRPLKVTEEEEEEENQSKTRVFRRAFSR